MKNTGIEFDYFYGEESQQFAFYRIPKILVKDERFKKLSSDAKLLYGLMLERMSLSMKNGWLDGQNRAYIIYTIEQIGEDLGIGRDKAIKILSDLDSRKGIGLVERIRRGQGKPDIIYVKNFVVLEQTEQKLKGVAVEQTDQKSEKSTSESRQNPEVGNSDFKKSEKSTSRNREIRLLEVGNSDPNYTDKNYTDMSYPDSIHLSIRDSEDTMPKTDVLMDEIDAYIQIIRENIDYDNRKNYVGYHDWDIYEELYQLICETVCVKRETVRIAGEDYPYQLVKSRFLKLNSMHLDYVIECMKHTTSKVGNIKAYMLTTLYNAPGTINHYYQQEVQHDLYGVP